MQSSEISALGVKKHEFLETYGKTDRNPDEFWADKLALDARAASGIKVKSHLVFGDIDPFVSPVDRSVINSRTDLREHNKVHDVTYTEDFKGQWEDAAKKRAAFANGTYTDKAMRESLEREFDRRS